MDNIKLNRIDNFQLNNNEKQQLKGGDLPKPKCTCGCCYANNGGSSVGENLGANADNTLKTKCDTIAGVVY